MDMRGRLPQDAVLVLANDLRNFEAMEHKVKETMAALNATREAIAAKRANKPGSASSYLNTQLATSHTPGTAGQTKMGGLFQNSVYSTAVSNAVDSPAFRRGFMSQLDAQAAAPTLDPEAFRKKMMGLQ
jgi:hypothetical protein